MGQGRRRTRDKHKERTRGQLSVSRVHDMEEKNKKKMKEERRESTREKKNSRIVITFFRNLKTETPIVVVPAIVALASVDCRLLVVIIWI